MSRIRVVLADDHPVIRAYLRGVLQQAPDIVVVGEASDGLQLLELACNLEPDVVLLDMEMPGLNGIQVTKRMHEKGLSIPIVVISSHNDKHFIVALFQLGIAGYLIKDEAPMHVVQAIRAVSAGQSGWISHRLAASVTSTIQEPVEEELSDLDRTILQLFSTGKSSEEISTSLGVQPNEIKQHLQSAVSTVRHSLSKMQEA